MVGEISSGKIRIPELEVVGGLKCQPPGHLPLGSEAGGVELIVPADAGEIDVAEAAKRPEGQVAPQLMLHTDFCHRRGSAGGLGQRGCQDVATGVESERRDRNGNKAQHSKSSRITGRDRRISNQWQFPQSGELMFAVNGLKANVLAPCDIPDLTL